MKGTEISSVYNADILEETLEKMELTAQDAFKVAYEPFKIYTFIID
jgi:hypothetical protein